MTTVIIKPTDGCNARCRYCSAAHPGEAKRMSAETLRGVFRLFGDLASTRGPARGRLCFIWHGGEPLLMPPSFWEEVFRGQEELLAARGIAFENRIQTNATRISPGSIPFLKRLLGENGTVGTSADPIPGIRELKGAPEGLYADAWAEGVRLLREAGIRYGILYVVHRESLPRLEEVYRHFRAHHHGIGIRFNALYRQGRACEGAVWDDLGITAEEWGRALAVLHRAWILDGSPPGVHPFGPWARLHDEGKWRLSCECSGKCAASHFGVDPGGSVYLCGRSADGGTFRFGDVGDLTAGALRDHPIRRALGNRIVYLRRTHCRDCPHWLYCHGGCVNDAVLAHGTPFAPTSFCAGLKTYFEEAYGAGREEAGGCAA